MSTISFDDCGNVLGDETSIPIKENKSQRKTMKKIIDIPENCHRIEFIGNTNSTDYVIKKDNIVDLQDHTPEPLTADGLTLIEFAMEMEKGKEIEWFTEEKWYVLSIGKEKIIYELILEIDNLQYYRIKPEIVHYHDGISAYNCLCGSTDMLSASMLTCDVTCPKCIEALTPKYKPWTFETAPNWFEDSNGLIWTKCFIHLFDIEEWGFVNIKDKYTTRYILEEVFQELKQRDGSPCGTKIEVYK